MGRKSISANNVGPRNFNIPLLRTSPKINLWLLNSDPIQTLNKPLAGGVDIKGLQENCKLAEKKLQGNWGFGWGVLSFFLKKEKTKFIIYFYIIITFPSHSAHGKEGQNHAYHLPHPRSSRTTASRKIRPGSDFLFHCWKLPGGVLSLSLKFGGLSSIRHKDRGKWGVGGTPRSRKGRDPPTKQWHSLGDFWPGRKCRTKKPSLPRSLGSFGQKFVENGNRLRHKAPNDF